MSLRRAIRTVLLFVPLLLLFLALALPYCSARFSLLLHGAPFARVVPKEKLDIFRYVQTDGFDIEAVVFDGDKAVGLIVQSLGSPPYFEPLSEANPEQWRFPFGFIAFVVTARFWGWLLLPIQAIVLLLWLRQREKALRFSGYDS
jgi:hypothetical protein